MEEKSVKIGVIGCGSRMKHVIRWILDSDKRYKIIAIYDPKKEATDDYLKVFGKDIKICNAYEGVVNDNMVDWVFIGSVNKYHKEQIIASFDAGKNVFSEKPLATSVSGCAEIKKAYEERKNPFFISYPLRFSPHYNKIREIVNQGKIGKIISMEFNEVLRFNHGAFIMVDWRRFIEISGGHLLEKCCHDMDVANWIIGSIPKRVASFGGLNFFKPENAPVLEEMENSKSKEEMDLYRKWKENPFLSNKDIMDNQVAIIEYVNGVRATFHTNCSSGLPERRMYICGTKGTIRADVLTGRIELKKIGPNEETIEIYDEENKGGHGGGDKFMIQALSNAILWGKTPEASMDDAVKSAVTALEIDRSRKEGKIIDLEPTWRNLGIDF